MKRPGANAPAPAPATPTIDPIIQMACALTRFVRMQKIAADMEINVHTVRRWIQLNDPGLSSRIQNDETVTQSIKSNHVHPKTLCRKVPFARAKFALPTTNAIKAVVR